MKRMLRISKCKYLAAGLAALAVGLAVLAWPVSARCEALMPEQVRAKAEDMADTPDPAGPPDRISVFVHVQPAADRGPIRAFASEKGGIVKYEYKTVLPNVMNLRNIPVTAVAALKRVPGVARVVEDKYHEHLIKLDESTPLIQGLQTQIIAAGFNADGSGVRVCVCDTGIDMDHIMYADRIDATASYDFHNNDPNPEDDHGHGAHVAGIAVGGSGLEVNFGCEGAEPFQGVAPEATLIGVKVLDQSGGGYDSNVIAGINHCADQSPSGGRADVINLSLGEGEYSGTCDDSLLTAAANAAVDAGVVVVAAAGNEGNSNALCSPACGSKVIAVGATYKDDYPNCEDSTDEFNWCLEWLLPPIICNESCTDTSPRQDDLVCFSNNSDNLDVVAPGSVIWSADIAGVYYIRATSGTSMASPHVAGLAALVLSMEPTLTPQQVRGYIRAGAIDMGPTGFDPGYGYGRIDVIETLSLLGTCGDGTCDDGEDPCNCADDCGPPPSTETDCTDGIDNNCDGSTDCADPDCGNDSACSSGNCNNNGVCDPGEDCDTCPDDCINGQGGGTCDACFKGRCDGRCQPSKEGSDCADCASSYCCGDGICEGDEDSYNCEVDCGQPQSTETDCTDGIDNDYDGLTDCADPDCGNDSACLSSSCNNDGDCDPGEDCKNCPNDCDGKLTGKPSGRYCCGNGIQEDPEGDGSICDGQY
jgi:subtilisin family serine protease